MSSNSFLMPNDLSDLCRVCLQLPEESQYLDLTTIYDEEDNLTYGECFTICTQINLSDGEGVPHHLCKSCGLELQMTYDFCKKVEESKRVIEQFQKQVEEKKANASEQQNKTSCDREQQHDTNLAHACIDATMPSQEESLLQHRQDVLSTSDEQETNEINIAKGNDQNKFTEQQEDLVLSDNIQADSNTGADIEEHLDMDDFQNVETLEEEEKSKKSLKEFKIKQECNNDDPPIENSTNPQNVCRLQCMETTIANEIHSECKIENDISNIRMKTLNEIKIEDEIISDNIVSTIIPGIYHPSIPTHTVNKKTLPNKMTNSKRMPTGGRPSFECEVCGYSLPTKNALYQHRQRKHNQKKSLRQNLPELKCRLCSKTFTAMSSLRQHLYSDHKNMGFACEHCGYNLPTKNALYQHRLRKHRNIERKHKHFAIKLKCMQSADSLKTQEILKTRLENQNSQKKRRVVKENDTWIECNVCGYKLPTRNALYQHRLRKHRNR